MAKPISLNVGFIKGESVYDEVIEEILNHQGVIYTKITHEAKKPKQAFPCVILSSHSKEAYELASKICINEENVIIANKMIPLEGILRALSGVEDNLSDPMFPFVNQHEEHLIQKLIDIYSKLNLPFIQKGFWPSFAKACLVLTHDVDWLYYSPFHLVVLRRRPLHKFLKLAFNSVFFKKNYGDNISYVVQEEEKRGLKSSFYFIPKYKFSLNFANAVELLRDKGFEIGFHAYYADKDKCKLESQKLMLENNVKTQVKGVRQHELKFSVPTTWKIEEEIGLSYDLTFFYNDKFGFRSGICLPYHPIDFDSGKKLSILEIPTSFMDFTVLRNRISYRQALEILNRLIVTIEKFNGVFTVCFHNTYLNEETFPEICRLYAEILDYAKEKKFWASTALECYSWWIKRENAEIKLGLKGNKVEIETSTYPLPLTLSFGKEKENLELTERLSEIDLHYRKKDDQ
jgi:hypothetical protein